MLYDEEDKLFKIWYEGVQIGFMTVYHLTQGELWDKIDAQLTFSRNDRNWVRAGERETFIASSTTPGEYDYGVIHTMHRLTVVGDEIWIYYTGYSGLH